MATSAEYQRQIEEMGTIPDFRNTIADAYKDPVLEPLVNEGATLEAEYLPSIFGVLANQGTGRGNMSAAGKLQSIGQSLGTLGSRISSNRNVQNFYNSQIQDLAAIQQQQWLQRYQQLKDLYSMQREREQAAAAAAAQQAQLDNLRALIAEIEKSKTGGGDGQTLNVGTPSNLEQLNIYRESKGLSPVSQGYYDTTYNRPDIVSKAPSYSEAIWNQARENLMYPDRIRNGEDWNWGDYGKYLGTLAISPGVLAIGGAGKLFNF